MKIFIYKSMIITFLIVVIFNLTINKTIKKYEKKIFENINKEKIEYFKEKIRDEIKSSLQKDKILNEEDALLLNKFYQKIIKEINSKN